MKVDDCPGAFLRSLAWDIQPERIEWFQMAMCVRLDGDRIAMIQLGHGICGSDYDRLSVSIVSKSRGEIGSLNFHFDTHLPPDARKDSRKDYAGFVVKEHQGWKWYIAIPADTRPLCSAVERFINLFC